MTEDKNTLNEELETETNVNEGELTEEETVEPVFAEEETSKEETNTELQTLINKLEEADNRYLRLQADFDNFRRRTRLDAEASEKYKAQKLALDLLPSIDNFERALKVEVDSEQAKSLLQGMEMVYRGLIDALKNAGVEAIDAVGKEFDPYFHQAVMQVEDENYGSNIVVEEFQKGYMIKDRVLRPAMVKVNQ